MKRKIVTLCGSIRFWDKIQEMAERLEIENEYAVIGLIPHVMNRDFTEKEKELIGELHKIKIDVSDAIFVVNVGGYIGESTRSEIEYAKSKEKEIIYLENNWYKRLVFIGWPKVAPLFYCHPAKSHTFRLLLGMQCTPSSCKIICGDNFEIFSKKIR